MAASRKEDHQTQPVSTVRTGRAVLTLREVTYRLGEEGLQSAVALDSDEALAVIFVCAVLGGTLLVARACRAASGLAVHAGFDREFHAHFQSFLY